MPDGVDARWLGRRVSIRRVIGRRDGRAQLGDVVGDLVRLDGGLAVVDTARGPVEIDTDAVVAARLAPPSTADELALERVAAAGWRAAHTSELGGWLLRANAGFTGRANSVLPLGAPGRPLDAALDDARRWYAGYGLPLRLMVPTEARRLLDAELGERGWELAPDVHVMVTRLDAVNAPEPRLEVVIDGEPDDAWLAAYRGGADATMRATLVRHPAPAFAAVRDGGAVVGIARGVVDDGWLGVSAVEVDPAARRRGIGGALVRALWRWASDRGAVRSYLQVSSDNPAAVAAWTALGYWTHHDYRYRTDPRWDGPVSG